MSADDYNSKVLSERGGAGQRVGYTKIGPRASPNRITQNHIQHDLADREGAHTRCHCTQGEVLGRYYSREAHKPYLWPRDMAINEHQLAESSTDAALCAGAHALSALL